MRDFAMHKTDFQYGIMSWKETNRKLQVA